jgi:histidyl-tRNA synthetase
MVGKWLGTDVPAVGISIGFERVVELVSAPVSSNGVLLVLEDSSLETIKTAIRFQKELIATGKSVRLELKPKKLNILLDSMLEAGFTQFAIVLATTEVLEFKNIR